ncbi:MAG: putative peptidoglycan lipid flippase [Actinomycetota bacterium]|nr:putative peptidoglycan lipid flippase [Actinomycetota bacterium]
MVCSRRFAADERSLTIPSTSLKTPSDPQPDPFEAAAKAAEEAIRSTSKKAENVINPVPEPVQDREDALIETASSWAEEGGVIAPVPLYEERQKAPEAQPEKSAPGPEPAPEPGPPPAPEVTAESLLAEEKERVLREPAKRSRRTRKTRAAKPAKTGGPGRLARSTAFFSIATAASRVAGLAREIVAAGYFGISGPMSAFTVAFQVPNLIRALFADAALQPAFVPIFTEQIEKGKYREAFRMASTLLLLVTMVLGAITAFFILAAGLVMPIFAPGFTGATETLMVVLSQILFPILILLGVTGVVVGILNSYDRFGAFAISPLFWNLTIIAVVIATVPLFPEDKQIYAYAIGVVAGTVVQLLIPTWDLRNTPFKFTFKVDFKDPNVRRVLFMMIPVTLSLGLINFNLLVNSFFGSLVSDEAPAAIDKAFRIYQLPQGIFSVAIATVLFPTLARFANRRDFDSLRSTLAKGMRQIIFVLVPASAAILVLSEPMIRVVYQRGEFGPAETVLVSTALYWFAFSLPTNGMYLLLSRTFFGLQKPWIPTWIAGANLAVTAIGSFLLYKPYGVAGIVAATAIATAVSVVIQTVMLRTRLGGIEFTRFLNSLARILIASAVLAGVSYEIWNLADHILGQGLVGQIISIGAGLGLGGLSYMAVCQILKVPELDQMTALVRRRS